ncbi:MAG: hypothetical protein HC869_05005 [Rhodospirillales bacterium]|nr:hypothetical protein [Rhodospirillales bacterium]
MLTRSAAGAATQNIAENVLEFGAGLFRRSLPSLTSGAAAKDVVQNVT